MVECTFELNGKPMSEFQCGPSKFPAFSGLGDYVNKRMTVCMEGFGAIPPGEYYIVDRISKGIVNALRNLFADRSEWFALLANDGKIDDEMFCNGTKRGLFRLHPLGPSGISKGCVVIKEHHHFQQIRGMLKAEKPFQIPGSTYLAYGKLTVR